MLRDLRLVPEEERPLVYCPEALREDHRRALMGVLEDLDVAVACAYRRALEGRFRLTAMSLRQARVLTRKLVELCREEA